MEGQPWVFCWHGYTQLGSTPFFMVTIWWQSMLHMWWCHILWHGFMGYICGMIFYRFLQLLRVDICLLFAFSEELKFFLYFELIILIEAPAMVPCSGLVCHRIWAADTACTRRCHIYVHVLPAFCHFHILLSYCRWLSVVQLVSSGIVLFVASCHFCIISFLLLLMKCSSCFCQYHYHFKTGEAFSLWHIRVVMIWSCGLAAHSTDFCHFGMSLWFFFCHLLVCFAFSSQVKEGTISVIVCAFLCLSICTCLVQGMQLFYWTLTHAGMLRVQSCFKIVSV
jgi:hypothetical protein